MVFWRLTHDREASAVWRRRLISVSATFPDRGRTAEADVPSILANWASVTLEGYWGGFRISASTFWLQYFSTLFFRSRGGNNDKTLKKFQQEHNSFTLTHIEGIDTFIP